jgi:UDP-glucuronate decarboxylase
MHLRKRVLVTGGAGFLGSFLCERLLQENCDVVCVDNFYTGTKRNIVHLLVLRAGPARHHISTLSGSR